MVGPFKPVGHHGVLHQFTSRLTAFEHASKAADDESPHHTLLFLGGLGDGYGHPRYPKLLAQYVPSNWSVAEVLLSSSFSGWTTSSLARDANELSRAVKYFRSLPGRSEEVGAKIVLMGHSTGSQVCMEYLIGPWKQPDVPQETLERQKVNGVIFQAGISDREGVERQTRNEIDASLEVAKQWVVDGRGEDVLPQSMTKGEFGASSSARRWISLMDLEGDDDYFSSDLPDNRLDRTFGEVARRRIPICILLSERDEHMPKHVDKTALMSRWTQAVARADGVLDEESGIVQGATHNLNPNEDDVKIEFSERVSRVVERFASQPDSSVVYKAEKL